MPDSDVVETSASPVATVPAVKKNVKKAVSAKTKKPAIAPTHPSTQQMVDSAIKTLKERGGSSLPAIKKYLTSTYKVDAQKLAPFIKKYLKNAVTSGKLIQTKGKGASGSFKLSATASKDPKSKNTTAEKKKATSAKKKKTITATKKSAAVKKSSAAKKTAEKKKSEKSNAKTAKNTGTVKTKPAKKAPATKPKAPKAKSASNTAKAKKVTAAKKTAAKKGATKK